MTAANILTKMKKYPKSKIKDKFFGKSKWGEEQGQESYVCVNKYLHTYVHTYIEIITENEPQT